MKEQEKRHGPLNNTCDASLDDLSEVSFLALITENNTKKGPVIYRLTGVKTIGTINHRAHIAEIGPKATTRR